VKYRTTTFELWKDGGIVQAKFHGSPHFRRAEVTKPLGRDRVFAVDTESLVAGAQEARGLRTLLVPVHFEKRTVVIETPDGRECLEKLFDEVFAQPGYAVKEGRPSRSAPRADAAWDEETPTGTRKKRKRAGRRTTYEPVLSVWFNLPYDMGRLLSDSRHSLRAIASGADSYRVQVGAYELEVVRMIFGSASSFEWFVRSGDDRIVRMLGLDLTGYWKSSLAAVAKAAGVTAKDDVESKIEDVYERPRESFSQAEWEMFRAYAAGDTITTLELYHRTVELLADIDARVIRKNGVIPPSAPGASARIVFAKAFDAHPEMDTWSRYPAWADQMGCDAYFGGRAFCTTPGVHSRMATLDLKSAYPFQMSLLPDPVTVEMVLVAPKEYGADRQAEFVEEFRGQYGILYVRGEGLDDVMPAFRVHDAERGGRLKYVAGPFDQVAVTIPELVIGVLRGAIRIDAVVASTTRNAGGVRMVGAPEHSFLRAGMRDFFGIKENKENEAALREMAKLLMNSAYGKLIEVKKGEFTVAEGFPMRRFVKKREVCGSIARIYASSGLIDKETYWGDSDAERAHARAYYRQAFEEPWAQQGIQLPSAGAADAVRSYVEALDSAGVAARGDDAVKIGHYLRSFKKYDCGQFFMPIYGAQITGATSAMVGLMAHVVGALQGDTDSVHVRLPEGVDKIGDLASKERYFQIMTEAGYPSPRMVRNGEGKLECVGGVPGLGKIGIWEEECPEPSVESVLVRPKLYSHLFNAKPSESRNGASTSDSRPAPDPISPPQEFKQAKHGFAKFHTPAVEAAHKSRGTREERAKAANLERKRGLHAAMRELLESGVFEYVTRRSPRRLREAIVHNLEVGEFTSREMKMVLARDPNTVTGADGIVRWKRGDV
jgi:DNA polymerase type B, organellar and viral